MAKKLNAKEQGKVLAKLISQGVTLNPEQRELYADGLRLIVKNAFEANRGLLPYFNKEYRCGTCGSKTGASHPETSFCFICNTDNWTPILKRKRPR